MRIVNRRPGSSPCKLGLAILILLCGSLASPFVGAAEKDIPCGPEPVDMLIKHGDLVFCTLGTPADTDVFRWKGRKGEQWIIRVLGLSGGIEPCFELFDPMGTPILRSACSRSDQFTQQIEAELTKDGTYTIVVGDGGRDEAGDYRVVLERIIPLSRTGRPIADFGVIEEDLIDPLGDMDLYAFTFDGVGGTVRIEARGLTTGGFEPCLFLYAPTRGLPVAKSACSATDQRTQVIVHSLSIAGQYVVVIDDGGVNKTGDYQLTVQCINGGCTVPKARDYLGTTAVPSFTGNRRPEIAVLRFERNVLSNGRVGESSRVFVEDGKTGRVVRKIKFFGDGWEPKALLALPDMPTSTNGVDELVVLAVSESGSSRFRIKDARTAATLGTVPAFDMEWDVRNMSTHPDSNGDGVPEIAVLATRRADGVGVVRVFDPVGGVRLRQFRFP